jgi:hypothetical protein
MNYDSPGLSMKRLSIRPRVFFLPLIGLAIMLSACQEEGYDPETRAFIAHFEGKIGKKDRLSADILCLGTSLSGYVTRAKDTKPLSVRGKIDGLSITLEGDDPRDESGRFSGRIDKDARIIKGEWLKADGSAKAPFTLSADMKKSLSFRTMMKKVSDGEGLEALIALPEPANASKDFLKLFRAEYLGGNPLAKELDQEIASIASLKNVLGASVGYRHWIAPYRNYGGILSLFEVEEIKGQGGVQTLKSLRTYSYAKGRRLELADILRSGMSDPLDEAITATLKLVYSLGPSGSLSNLGFAEDRVRATASFGLAEDGILFFFPAGSQADRGLGDISVYIPSSLVGDMVKSGVFRR